MSSNYPTATPLDMRPAGYAGGLGLQPRGGGGGGSLGSAGQGAGLAQLFAQALAGGGRPTWQPNLGVRNAPGGLGARPGYPTAGIRPAPIPPSTQAVTPGPSGYVPPTGQSTVKRVSLAPPISRPVSAPQIFTAGPNTPPVVPAGGSTGTTGSVDPNLLNQLRQQLISSGGGKGPFRQIVPPGAGDTTSML